ncbi:MAG TPA: hypothetical protein DCL38_06580 [Lachnospiraceae bacterium]|nr:hypothetical protein [Lachnospiraceae bacterium]
MTDNNRDNTEIILDGIGAAEQDRSPDIIPTLFVCQGRTITEYRLMGRQEMGRPAYDSAPDIPVFDRFVSRKHGFFDTEVGESFYTAAETTNGILYKGQLLTPGDRVSLKDGDELIIPSGSVSEGQSVILIYVCTEARLDLWHEFKQASKDKLTGLYGRDSFTVWWYQNCRKKDYSEAVLFILDLDDFKQINDQKGHNEGDAALRLVADQLRHAVRYEYQVCRWGGDEFVGIIPGNTVEAGNRLKEISKRIEKYSSYGGTPVSVSIGYVDVKLPGNLYDMAGILELADKALYKVKSSGKRGIVCYKSGKKKEN